MWLDVTLNTQRKKLDGTCAVRLEVRLRGRARYTFSFSVKPEQWDDRFRRVKGRGNAAQMNRKIASVLSRAEVLALEDGATAQSIVTALKRPDHNGILFSDAIEVVLTERASRFKPGTLRRMKMLHKWVSEAIPYATLEGMTSAHVYKCREYVFAREVQQNTLRNRLTLIKALYAHCCSHFSVGEKDIFYGVIPRELDPQVENLEPSELEKLLAYGPPQKWALARHAFLLAMYLGGMRWEDLKELPPERITQRGLATRQGKSGSVVYAGISDAAREIIDLYKGGEKVLPLPSHVTIWRHLKCIAKAIGINPGLSIHMARHAAADLMDEAGVKERDIQILLGHSSLQQTVNYLEKRRERQLGEALKSIGKVSQRRIQPSRASTE